MLKARKQNCNQSISHGEITYMAKEVTKVNNKLMEAVFAACELDALDDLKDIVADMKSPVFQELCQQIAIYSHYESVANLNDPALDEALTTLSKIFSKVYL